MAFSIAFLDEPLILEDDNPTIPSAVGRLVIGDWEEEFVSSLFRWSKEDYQDQWLLAIKSLLNGNDKVALITEYLGPEGGRLWWWPVYRIEETAYFQEQILFFDQLGEPFSMERAFSFVKDRQTTSGDGDSISEWSVNLSEIKEFARTLFP